MMNGKELTQLFCAAVRPMSEVFVLLCDRRREHVLMPDYHAPLPALLFLGSTPVRGNIAIWSWPDVEV